MKVLVTGGRGFIGWHVCEALKRMGHEPVVFDRTAKLSDNPIFLGDVRDEGAVFEAVELCGGVIHLAGVLGTQETVNSPRSAIDTNIMGSLNVFEALREQKKRGVYISIGNWWMNNPYSISKNCAERLALMYNEEHDTQISVVRGLNVFGPRQKSAPVRKIAPTFIRAALCGKPIVVYGDGEQMMDMIYVEDVADILVAALTKDNLQVGVVFEAGTGVAPSVNRIATTIIELSRSTSEIVHVPMRPGEIPKSVVRADIKTLLPLGVERFTPMETAMNTTIEWYRSHPC